MRSEFKGDAEPPYYEVKVFSLDGSTLIKTYKIAVRYPDLSLKSFVLRDSADRDNLNEFDYLDTLSHTLTLPYDVKDSLVVRLQVADTASKVTLKGGSDLSSLLTVGDKKAGWYRFKVGVKKAHEGVALSVFTVQDGSVKREYRLSLSKAWDLRLKSFVLTAGADYTNEVPELTDAVSEVLVDAGVKLEDLEVTEIKTYLEDRYVSTTWSLNNSNGNYSVRIKVSAPDKTSKTYTVSLRHPSSDAFLSYFFVPDFVLVPAFAPAIEEYTVIVPSEQASIRFITAARHGKAEVKGDGEHTLHGDSTFAIVVTAEDGTTKTYKVTVTDGTHTGIQLAGGSSVQVYVSNQSLHVSTPTAERVSVYSAGGQLLYSLDKPAGKAFVSTFPKGVLIVKGSSGWVKKVALH